MRDGESDDGDAMKPTFFAANIRFYGNHGHTCVLQSSKGRLLAEQRNEKVHHGMLKSPRFKSFHHIRFHGSSFDEFWRFRESMMIAKMHLLGSKVWMISVWLFDMDLLTLRVSFANYFIISGKY